MLSVVVYRSFYNSLYRLIYFNGIMRQGIPEVNYMLHSKGMSFCVV